MIHGAPERAAPAAAAPSGVLIVDKPRGPTSHDVVARARRALKTRHVGHAGTLDPMATGVLVLAVGEATKLVPWLTADDKTYEAVVRLGVATDTLDAEGQEVSRAGQLEADLPERPVEVRSLDVVGERIVDGAVELDVRVEATKGYFVRSLARDLARGLGTVGHLTALRRVRSGAFTVADAIALEAVSRDALMSVTEAASRALPVTVLNEAGVRAASHGQRVAPEQMKDAHARPSAWVDGSPRLVAIGERDDDGWGRVLRGFPAA